MSRIRNLYDNCPSLRRGQRQKEFLKLVDEIVRRNQTTCSQSSADADRFCDGALFACGLCHTLQAKADHTHCQTHPCSLTRHSTITSTRRGRRLQRFYPRALHRRKGAIAKTRMLLKALAGTDPANAPGCALEPETLSSATSLVVI